jgi:hypothetical protein
MKYLVKKHDGCRYCSAIMESNDISLSNAVFKKSV